MRKPENSRARPGSGLPATPRKSERARQLGANRRTATDRPTACYQAASVAPRIPGSKIRKQLRPALLAA